VSIEIPVYSRGTLDCESFFQVILSGGAINSPQLLLLSGIGPEEHLRSVGIEPQVNLPGVGENLQDHLEVSLIFSLSYDI